MKKRKMKRSKTNGSELRKQSKQKRQEEEYPDIQGKRKKQNIKIMIILFSMIFFGIFGGLSVTYLISLSSGNYIQNPFLSQSDPLLHITITIIFVFLAIFWLNVFNKYFNK